MKVSSQLLAVSNQQIINGKRIDYESLSKPKERFRKNLGESILEINQYVDTNITSSSNDIKIKNENIISYEVMRSEIVVFELLNKLYFDYQDNKYLSDKINAIEATVLKEKKFDYKTDYSETIKNIKDIKIETVESYPKFSMDISYIMGHLIFIDRSKRLIDEKTNKISIQSDNIKNNIYVLTKKIDNHFEKERHRIFASAMFFIFLSVATIFFAVYQIRRVRILNSKIKNDNENHDKAIKNRTKRIENEKQESENILKSLLVVQKRIFTLINNIEGCLYEYDLDTNKVSFISSGLEKIWGLTKDQVLGGDELRNSIYIEDREQ